MRTHVYFYEVNDKCKSVNIFFKNYVGFAKRHLSESCDFHLHLVDSVAVSYTHLDVYKRQPLYIIILVQWKK